MKNILNYRHQRNAPFVDAASKLYAAIERAAATPRYRDVVSVFSKVLKLSEESIAKESKFYFLISFDFINGVFPKKFCLKSVPQYLAKYLAFHVYVLIKSKKQTEPIKSYEAFCEDVQSKVEADRFLPLLSKFESSAVVSTVPIPGFQYPVVYCPRFKNYNRSLFLRTSWKTLLLVPYLLLESLRQRINLFAVFLSVLDRYYYYQSTFSKAKARYLIQERHYGTSAIKNELFHQAGGQLTSTIQKNIVQVGYTSFYYDIDRFYALGTRTVERALDFGAKIKKIVPVGSYFMESYWFQKPSGQELPIYDFVNLAGNIGLTFNTYNEYWDDYYEHFRWMVKFANRHPDLKIGIKHHSNNIPDPKEVEIIKGSRVERIDQSLPSYALSFKARCVGTWASTMGYELIGHGTPCLFMDPGRRNIGFLPTNDLIDDWRATTYEEYEAHVLKYIKNGPGVILKNKMEELCLESSSVSQRIVDDLRSR